MATQEDPAPAPTSGSSRLQHFQAPVETRRPNRRRYSEISINPSGDVSFSRSGDTSIHEQPQPRKSLDGATLQSTLSSDRTALSHIVFDAMRKRGSRRSISGATSDSFADTKGKRYAEMMERFQIRRVTRTLSSSQIAALGPPAGTAHTARDPSEHPARSMASVYTDHQAGNQSHRSPGSIPSLGSLSARPDKAFTELGSRRDLESAAKMLGPGDSTETSPSKMSRMDRSSRVSLYWWLVSCKRRVIRDVVALPHMLAKPISPSSTFSRVRLVVLLLAFTVHVVLFPLQTAFFPRHDIINTGTIIGVGIELVLLLDFALMFNTAYYKKRNHLVTSRREIARHYVQTWFLPDLISSVPVDLLVLMGNNSHSIQSKWLQFSYDVACRSQRMIHLVRLARSMWTGLLDSPERSVFEWLLYSRYSHLLRIAWIILFIILVAHYLACGWRLLFITRAIRGSPLEEYVTCFYDVLQLLQGQGVPTTTVAQNIYATVAILMGSIVLAIIFGNVAILVANFNANATSYQRKMESVFAVMSKLQLPPPLRERIHQYYEHLWREYESLDGEIVAFAKGLSHTLELEVVLFKYMDLIMHVPFWRDESPDFQKQLMLSLHVRVYLPDDFIIRRGEVGDEFFMINRGVCELALGPDSFECTIGPLGVDRESSFCEPDQENEDDPELTTARFQLPSMSRRHDADPPVARSRVYSLDESTGARVTAERTSSKYLQKLRRGQSFGEIALVMNYERTANVRALTYVEMCVLHRRDFQAILLKHPTDRKQVLTKILTKTIANNEATNVACPLKAAVESVFGEGDETVEGEAISAMHAGLLISNAVNLPLEDESIKFGIGERLHEQLVALRNRQRRKGTTTTTPANASRGPSPCPPPSQIERVEPASADVQGLADQVQQLTLVQTQMASTMLALTQEVQKLCTANEQLQRVLSVYDAQLTEMMRSQTTPSNGTSSSPVPLSRRLSQLSMQSEGVQATSIPENRPRVVPVALVRSASMVSLHSARSVSVSCVTGQDAEGQDETSRDHVAKLPTPSVRTGRFSPLPRSHTAKNVVATASSSSSAAATAERTASVTNDPRYGRSSLNARILMPLRALLTADTMETPSTSPTMYADQLFRDKSQKSPAVLH